MYMDREGATELVENCVAVTEVVAPEMLSELSRAEMDLDTLDGFRILIVHEM
jgi:hypothetical protein